jgi:subtilisin family serine protease
MCRVFLVFGLCAEETAMKTNTKHVILNVLLALTLMSALLVGSVIAPQASSVASIAAPSQASYIIQGPSQARLVELVARYGGAITSTLEIIKGVAATLPAGAAERLRTEPGITNVTPNAQVGVSDKATPAEAPAKGKLADARAIPNTDYPNVTGATVAWQKGVTGSGVSVAVLDTGIALSDGLIKDADGKTTKVVAWKDFVKKMPIPIDPNGHGTHVAAIIANSQKGPDGDYNGMAPGANLVIGRVLDDNGYGTYERIIAGIQWVVSNRAKYNIKVLNLSLNGDVHSPYWADPLDQAVTAAWAQGITVVVAAGNKGPSPMSIGVPGNNPYAITVGAFTDHYTINDWSDDYVTDFSSSGPTLDAFVKPDVVAPGAHIVSKMPILSVLSLTHEANWISNQYFSMAGTSQSAAVVSGVAALTVSKNVNLTPNQVKYRILSSALPWVDAQTHQAIYSVWQQGSGRVNAADAVLADMQGEANAHMDIQADLAGTTHYEGFSFYDKTAGQFKLRAPFDSMNTSYVDWNGSYTGYGSWSDGYGSWSDGYGSWSDGYGSWSDGYGSWSDGYGSWSDGYGSWSDGYGSWSDGYLAWAGGYGSWSDSLPWASTAFAKPDFTKSYKAGVAPNINSATVTTDLWVVEH